MNKYDSFWDDIDFSSTEKFPIELLKYQAAQIEINTKGLLKGEVETTINEEVIYNTLYIVAPSLNNYRYALLKIASTSKPYPVFIYDNSQDENAIRVKQPRKIVTNPFALNMGIMSALSMVETIGSFEKVEYVGISIPEPDINASNYKEFEEGIRKIISSKEATAVIHSLLAQCKEQTEKTV